jgi:hypothetical protein
MAYAASRYRPPFLAVMGVGAGMRPTPQFHYTFGSLSRGKRLYFAAYTRGGKISTGKYAPLTRQSTSNFFGV